MQLLNVMFSQCYRIIYNKYVYIYQNCLDTMSSSCGWIDILYQTKLTGQEVNILTSLPPDVFELVVIIVYIVL
jgi:hypothetical protein